MAEAKLEFPEVAGKVVAELSVYEDDEYGKEVLVRFTVGTQLSIAVGMRQLLTLDIAMKRRRIFRFHIGKQTRYLSSPDGQRLQGEEASTRVLKRRADGCGTCA